MHNEEQFDAEISHALSLDPLQEAEYMTGKSYKDDDATGAIGLVMHLHHNKVKRELLGKSKDLHHSCSFEYFEAVMDDMGFELVLEENFSNYQNKCEEVCQIWWDNKRSILAWATSYTWKVGKDGVAEERTLNNATFYGCFTCFDGFNSFTSSGCMYGSENVRLRDNQSFEVNIAKRKLAEYDMEKAKDITDKQVSENLGITVQDVQDRMKNVPELEEWDWVGSWHYEGVRYKLKNINTWKNKWAERPFLWLVNFKEEKELDKNDSEQYKVITESRIQKLPKHIQECITP